MCGGKCLERVCFLDTQSEPDWRSEPALCLEPGGEVVVGPEVLEHAGPVRVAPASQRVPPAPPQTPPHRCSTQPARHDMLTEYVLSAPPPTTESVKHGRDWGYPLAAGKPVSQPQEVLAAAGRSTNASPGCAAATAHSRVPT